MRCSKGMPSLGKWGKVVITKRSFSVRRLWKAGAIQDLELSSCTVTVVYVVSAPRADHIVQLWLRARVRFHEAETFKGRRTRRRPKLTRKEVLAMVAVCERAQPQTRQSTTAKLFRRMHSCRTPLTRHASSSDDGRPTPHEILVATRGLTAQQHSGTAGRAVHQRRLSARENFTRKKRSWHKNGFRFCLLLHSFTTKQLAV